MVKWTRNAGVIILLLAMVIFVLAISQGFAADLQSLISKAEAKYAKFEEQISDMTILQEMKMITPEGEMTAEMEMFKKGKMFRLETTMNMPQELDIPGGMKTITIYDGNDMWIISPFMGKQKLPSEEVTKHQKDRWWEFITENAKTVGTERIGNRECYVVQIEDKTKTPFTKLWLDKEILVLVKGESKGPTGETILWVNSDFRKINGGWEIPYKTEMYGNGKLISIIQIKSLKLNKGLSADLFDPNKIK